MDKADVVGSVDTSVDKVENDIVEADVSRDGTVDKVVVEDDIVEVDVSRVGIVDKVVVEDVLVESSFMLKTSGIVIPATAKSRIPINKDINSRFFLWKNPFPSDMSLKDVNRSFFEWL